MPNVKGKKFPYTAKGKAEAAAYANAYAKTMTTKVVKKKKK